MDANGRIQVRVKIAGAPKNFRRNLIFLGGGSWVVYSVVCQIAQQLAQRFRAVQGMAAKKFVDLSPVMNLVCHFRHHPGPDIVTLHE